ncbi:MAG: hypothetical protein LEGION0398_MBIBDBAK_00173 [Legionellaceae bacterium]
MALMGHVKNAMTEHPLFLIVNLILVGMLCMAIVISGLHKQHKPEIATINITRVINGFVKEEAQKNLSSDTKKAHVKAFGKRLEKSLLKIAHDKQVVLLPSEAVIAGASDYTSLLLKEMKGVSLR